MFRVEYDIRRMIADHSEDRRTAMPLDFVYDHFQGVVKLRDGQIAIGQEWEISVLDMALSVVHGAKTLPQTGNYTFEYADADLRIVFELVQQTVRIVPDWADSSITVPYLEFATVARRTLDSVREEIESTRPEVLDNPHYTEIIRIVG